MPPAPALPPRTRLAPGGAAPRRPYVRDAAVGVCVGLQLEGPLGSEGPRGGGAAGRVW
jgi:hypothetical protein